MGYSSGFHKSLSLYFEKVQYTGWQGREGKQLEKRLGKREGEAYD